MLKKIKIFLLVLTCYVVPIVGITTTQVGCTMTQKRIAYNSVYSLAISVDSSMRAFADLYVRGEVSKESWEKVKVLHATYQSILKISVEALKYDLSKEASTELVKAALDVIKNAKKDSL